MTIRAASRPIPRAAPQFGYALGWTMFLTTPFMIAIQLVSARIGAVTGRGLAANLGKAMPPFVLYSVIALLLIANTSSTSPPISRLWATQCGFLVGGPAAVYIALALGLAASSPKSSFRITPMRDT